MPDFTFVTMQMCKSIDGPLTTYIGGYIQTGMFSERHVPECTCDQYALSVRNGTGYMPSCEHIKLAEVMVCGWHQQWSDEVQTGEQREQHICPRCGGPTVVVRVAV